MLERSWVRIQVLYTGWTFFTLICCINCIVCLKRPKINEIEAGVWPIKNSGRRTDIETDAISRAQLR